MKKFFSFFAFFVLGVIFNNLVTTANAYINSSTNSLDIYDFNSAVEKIIEDKISSYDYNFRSEVENIVERCKVYEDNIDC